MNMITTLLKLFGVYREPTVESITSPMAKIVAKLEDFATLQSSLAAEQEKTAKELLTKADKSHDASFEASTLAARYRSLTLHAVSVPAE